MTTTVPVPVLGRDQVDRYHRDGFLFPLPLFTASEAAVWGAEVLDLAATGIPGHPAPWHQKSYLLLPSLDRLVRDRRLTDAVAAVLGEHLLVLSADLFVKPPGSTRRITWHQDVNYWRLDPLDVLTAWVALTPATPANGCVRYVAGAHLARVAHVERPATDNMLSRGQEVAVAVREQDAVAVVLDPGQVSFHHALTPHASGANTTTRARVGLAIRYAPTSVAQTGGPPISARLARGSDHHGHFALESGPDAPRSVAALAEHARALAPHAGSGYATV